jgi:hypothetical protein
MTDDIEREHGIRIVPLFYIFHSSTTRAVNDLSTDETSM